MIMDTCITRLGHTTPKIGKELEISILLVILVYGNHGSRVNFVVKGFHVLKLIVVFGLCGRDFMDVFSMLRNL